MSGQEWAPGTVAVVTHRLRGATGRGFRSAQLWFVVREDGSVERWDDVTDVRPLVVLDLDPTMYDAPLLQNLVDALRADWPSVASQIEAQTRPPKPPEPTNRYAVVRDRHGIEWLRDRGGTWCRNNHGHWQSTTWNAFDTVEVLSEGVA